MKPTAEAEAQGLRAYEQARAFERMRPWRLPAVYIAPPLLAVFSGVEMLRLGHLVMAGLNFLSALLLALAVWFHWRWLRRRHAKNLALLAELEAAHGDQLPWVRVEKHFAALAELKRELAGEKHPQEP